MAAQLAVSTAQLALDTAQMLQDQNEQNAFPSTSSAAFGLHTVFGNCWEQQQQQQAYAGAPRRSRRNSCCASIGCTSTVPANPFLQQFQPPQQQQPASSRSRRRCSYSACSLYEQQLFTQRQQLLLQASAGASLPGNLQHASASGLLPCQQQQQPLQASCCLRKPRRNSACILLGGAVDPAAAAAAVLGSEHRPPRMPRARRASWSCAGPSYGFSGFSSSSSSGSNCGYPPGQLQPQLGRSAHQPSLYGAMPSVPDSTAASWPLPVSSVEAGSSAGSYGRPGSTRAAAAAAGHGYGVPWAQTQLLLHEEEQGEPGAPFTAAAAGVLAGPAGSQPMADYGEGFDDGFYAGLHAAAASSSGLLHSTISQPLELRNMPQPGMLPPQVQLAGQQMDLDYAAHTAAVSAAAAAATFAAQQHVPYDTAAAPFRAYEAQEPHPMLADESSSSSMLASSELLQQLLLQQQQQHQMQHMQQQAISQPLPKYQGLGSSFSSVSMPLSSAGAAFHAGSLSCMQQQQQQSYGALVQQQQQQAPTQLYDKTYSSDSASSCSTSGLVNSCSHSSKAAAGAGSLAGGCGAEQLLNVMSTLNQELQQLQQLRSQLAAAAATAAQGTPIAAACQAAAQLHQDTVHQALAVKAAMEVSIAVQDSTGAEQGAVAAAAAAGLSEQAFGRSHALAAAGGGGGADGDWPGLLSKDDSAQMSCTVGSTV